MAAEIRLTPAGRLRWEAGEDARDFAGIAKTFQEDWRAGLFALAAEKVSVSDAPSLRFWRDWSARWLTALCHVPESAELPAIEPPTPAERTTLSITAPPMQGGEYLSPQALLDIWQALEDWTRQTVADVGGLAELLRQRAPKWRQVGRVCFHLAENKADEIRPFAFLATYATGFGTGGQLKHLPLRKALEQYAGTQNRPGLIRLLSPVQQASERIPWVKELVDSGAIYQPLAWAPQPAYRFLRSASELEECGLEVRLPNWWRKRSRPQVSVSIGNQKTSSLGARAVLDFDMRIALGNETISPEELNALLAGDDGLQLIKGQWVEVDREKLQQAIDHWQALRDTFGNGVSYIEGMRLLAGASADLKSANQDEEERSWARVSEGAGLREILEGLRQPEALGTTALAKGFRATLRPYQQEGLSWLRFLTELGLGACLADDMGLGKTIQVLALLCSRRAKKEKAKPNGAPSLLIVPASLLGNWRDEAARFAPELKVTFLHPAETDRQTLDAIAKAPDRMLGNSDLAITTYSMAPRQDWLATQRWHLVILDEAQAIKNPSTRQSKAVKKLKAEARIVLTGTPVENRLGDLWSLFDFVNPGLLGSANTFKQFVKALQERERDQFAPLRRLAGPYILRRLKTDRSIIADLPDKTETVRYCSLSKRQVALYERTVRDMQTALEKTDAMARRGLVLQSLMRLKQICNHPSQLTGDGDYKPTQSGKFLRLSDICEELADRQEKALIFTQFREIIDPLADFLAGIFGKQGLILHGGTSVKRRQAIVEQFQAEEGPPFFVLSLKAGGTGLNLTAAAHVIHFDRWWNPAVENQATDRAFRIGQKQNVLVHKFITRGTVEERIDKLIAEKQDLAREVLAAEGEVKLTELPDDELLRLVQLDVTRATV